MIIIHNMKYISCYVNALAKRVFYYYNYCIKVLKYAITILAIIYAEPFDIKLINLLKLPF